MQGLLLACCVVLQALAAQKEAIAREKEMEVARLRAMQEKQADHQSEQDELRARRYQVRMPGCWRLSRGSQDGKKSTSAADECMS
jgi:hypothetical protein